MIPLRPHAPSRHLPTSLLRGLAALALGGLLALLPSASARAEGETASATVKAAAAVENRLPVGESDHFHAGDRIYVWSEVRGADGRAVEHVWKRDGREFRRARFDVHSKVWRVNSRIPGASPGHYRVEVVANDATLGGVEFVVE